MICTFGVFEQAEYACGAGRICIRASSRPPRHAHPCSPSDSHLLINERNEPTHTTRKHGGRLAAAPSSHKQPGLMSRLSAKNHTQPPEGRRASSLTAAATSPGLGGGVPTIFRGQGTGAGSVRYFPVAMVKTIKDFFDCFALVLPTPLGHSRAQQRRSRGHCPICHLRSGGLLLPESIMGLARALLEVQTVASGWIDTRICNLFHIRFQSCLCWRPVLWLKLFWQLRYQTV